MTLARRGTRRITVDGVEYRWKVRPRPTYSQGNGWSPMTFAVEHADHPGTTLVVALPWPHPSNWLSLPSGTVTPAMVAQVVRQAVAAGWHPSRPGSPFHLAHTPTTYS